MVYINGVNLKLVNYGNQVPQKNRYAKDKPTETTFVVPRDHASEIASQTIEDVTWVKNMF